MQEISLIEIKTSIVKMFTAYKLLCILFAINLSLAEKSSLRVMPLIVLMVFN